MTAVAFRAIGRVQGVAFRAFTRRTAERLGVGGWVRNEPDGAVTGAAEGADDAVQAFIEALRQGPPAARVDDLQVTNVASTGARSFTIR